MRGLGRSWILDALIRTGGYLDEDLKKPIVEIVNTWSEWNPGHNHLRRLSEAVKRGVWQEGGFPLEYNTLSLCPGQTLPNRNLLAMETEAVFLSEPAEAAVFICTCDKDVPALLMASVRINVPSIFVLGGSMLPGLWKGKEVVCCTDYQWVEADYRAGRISLEDIEEFYRSVLPCSGACGPMGTANTMQSLTEALGMALPGSASVPAVMAEASALAEASGKRVMGLLKEGLKPKDIITEKSMENAIRVLMAIGGSTNAIIHLIALARQADLRLPLERFDELSRTTPFIADVKPSGRYAAIDLHRAGGIAAVMKELEPLLHLDALTVTGRTVGENLAKVSVKNREVIRSLDKPILPEGGLAILRGNLAPDGAVLKHSGSLNRDLLQHKGPAIVFNSTTEAYRTLMREDLEVTEDHVLVLRYQGPKAACMPETGMLPIPTVLVRKGVVDMVRVSDGRTSGTHYGTNVLHVSPEAYVGGPLAIVQDGDIIELDLRHRRIDVKLTDKQIEERLKEWKPPEPQYNYKRGPLALWYNHCMQADKGCLYPWM
jgi:dihydroxy-acid dehydratase